MKRRERERGRCVCGVEVEVAGGVWCGRLGLGNCTFIASLHSLLYSRARSHRRPPHRSVSPRLFLTKPFAENFANRHISVQKMPYRARLRRDSTATTTHPSAFNDTCKCISGDINEVRLCPGGAIELDQDLFVIWCACEQSRVFCVFL